MRRATVVVGLTALLFVVPAAIAAPRTFVATTGNAALADDAGSSTGGTITPVGLD